MNDLVISQIRTLVPVLVGWVGARLLSWGFDIDEATVSNALIVIVSAVWYAAVRWAERRWPRIGWLLGVPKQPTYPAA